ncbi:MAG: endo-1,4-beta-xylanase [Halococcoides sp.]
MTRKVEPTDAEESATDEDDGPTGRVDRRDYLRALGGLGVGGLGAAGVGSMAEAASAQTGFDESAADQRIRENQTGPLTVEVVNESGTPVADVSVSVEMTEHDFGWGTMVNAGNLLDRFGEGSQYYQHLRELFNTAVMENIHKWAIWEGNIQRADRAVDWLDQNGFRIRGHTCVYGVEYAIPSDVLTAARNGDGQTVRQRTMAHLREIITHYGDQIQEWDVVNEAIHRGKLQQGVYPNRIDPANPKSSQLSPWTTQLLADWYNEAESVIAENGLDVDVVTNDYNTLRWAQNQYYEQGQFLADQGVGVDAMGHQAHLGPTNLDGQVWSYPQINRLFDKFADLPGTQRITEYDMAGDAWSGQQQRAEVMRAFLKTAYGHPDVDEFVIWGMWDQTHWQGEAPFFQEDWTPKPALDEWRNLVLDEWWTSASGTTDGSGTYTVDAFLGDHEVQVTGPDGTTHTATVSVTDSNAGAQVTVTVSGGATPADPPAVTPVEMNGTYRVANVNSGQVLSVENASTGREASVVQRPDEGAPDQQWTVEHLGDGIHRIENVASGLSLDVLNAQVGDGANVIQWPWNGQDNQRFLVGETDTGDLVMVAQHSNRVVEVASASTASGANVQQWTYNGGDHQHWTFEAVEEGPPTLGEAAPTDPDGDGLYEDLSGDGTVNFPDVNLLFQNSDTAAVRDNAQYFDFESSGTINLQDVMALFQMV